MESTHRITFKTGPLKAQPVVCTLSGSMTETNNVLHHT
jgi:hypothetical protein